ncbi:MAG TPA: SDR family oxidoreductase [Flavisolibacter sp.]|jgi:dTDP-4-dehydrorhamnose reductase|nr:SDR family oxidoreductase [Flavisolibacter sp.]
MSKNLVTGANGFLGYYLVQQLLQKEHKVIASGKGANRLPYTEENFRYLSLDFTDIGSVAAAFAEIKPEVVVHCGAISKPDECELNREAAFLSNVTGTINLLERAAEHKAHFIFMSTDFVFNGEKGFYREDDERAPVNYYGQTKLLAEDEVVKYPFAWNIVRTVLAYGKTFSGRENIVTNTAKALREGRPLKIFDDQQRTPTYIEDLAAGIVTIIEKRAGGIYHLSGEDVRTPYDVALETAKFLNLDTSLITAVKAEEFDQPAARPPKTGFDISKARQDLGYQPLSFPEGLRKTFQYF